MGSCEVCGNDYDKTMEVIVGGERHVFDSFECAIHAIAPSCEHCECRIIGHGIEAGDALYCGAHCAHEAGIAAAPIGSSVRHARTPALAGVRALLIDIDGVLYVDDEPVAGARAGLARLRASGLGMRFLTNTTARSRARTLEKLRSLGFEVADGELVTPAALALAHCREHGHRTAALVMNDEVKRDFTELEQAECNVDVVIVGDLGQAFSYEVLNRAFRLVMDGAELVALQKNRFWLTADGLSLDVGPFVAALEYATGRDAYVVGKPAGAFFLLPLAELGIGPEAAVMVGDDVESDVGGALDAGLRAVLVRTGKYRSDVVAASGIEPTAVVESIADVPALVGVAD